MTRFLLLSIVTVFISCAGTGERGSTPGISPEPAKPFVLPKVSGEIELVFERTLGGNIDIKSPWGLSFGIDGTLYLCDRDNSSILRIEPSGEIVSSFSGFDSRTERLFLPSDVSVSGGIEIYALDSVNSRILRLDRNLKNAYAVYQPDSGGDRSMATFGTFGGLAFDQTSGDIFVTDRDNGTVIRIDMLGGNIHTSGKFGSERMSLSEPLGLDVDGDGALYIADRANGAVGILSHFGGTLSFIGGDILEAPVDVAVLPDSRFIAADTRGVMIFDKAGNPLTLAGYGTDREMSPRSVAYSDGKIYISDALSSSVLVYGIEGK
ncbi:NHL repeat-containing protein [Candidatus Latescibacterota bacterium]